ncbi:MAG TPA: HAD family hydrolase [Myxococcota bacterium]|nr:HAD family hydrolase [Myxococcota bacterium]
MAGKAKAILFDVDGTLVRAAGAGKEAMAVGLARAAGLSLDAARAIVEQIDFRGCTDALLVEQMSARVGGRLTGQEARLIEAYLEALDETLAARQVELLPGVHTTLETLARAGVTVGLLTGNVRAGARKKLSPFNLSHLTDAPGGFGDDGRDRGAIARLAVERLGRCGVEPTAVLIIGDTEHDVAAARAAGVAAATVATGWTPPDVLRAAAPDLHMNDLTDTTPLLAFLDGFP